MYRPAHRPAWAARTRAAAGSALTAALILPTGVLAAPAAGAAPTGPTPGPPALSSSAAVSIPASPLPTARVAGEEPGLRLLIDDVSPTVPRVGEPVVLIGRVVNESSEQHRLSTVTARAAWSTIEDREGIDAWLGGRDRRELGWELGRAATGPVVASGSEVPFRITVPGAVLGGLPGDEGVLAVELTTQAPTEDGSGGGVAASLRTVLTLTREAQVEQPLDIAWAVPLTLPADPGLTDPDETVRLAAWDALSAPDAPVRTWLEALSVPGTTWAVDPALLVAQHPPPSLLELALDGPSGTDAPGENAPGADSPESGTTTEAPAPAAPATASPAPTTQAPAPTTQAPPAPTATSVPTPATTRQPTAEEEPAAGSDTGQPLTRRAVDAQLAEVIDLLADVADEQLWWLPAHDPDLAALLAVTPRPVAGAVVAGALARTVDGPTTLDRLQERGRDDIAWPLLEEVTAEELTRIDESWRARDVDRRAAGTDRPADRSSGAPGRDGVAAVVIPREAVTGPGEDPIGQAAAPVAGTTDDAVVGLARDARASALLGASAELTGRTGAGAVAQRLLADTLTAWQQDPGQERSLLVAAARDTVPDADLLRELSDGVRLAPWLEARTAASLLAAADEAPAVPLSGGTVDPALPGELAEHARTPESPVTSRTTRALAQLATELTGIAQVLDGDGGSQSWDGTLAGLWSTRWREDHEGWVEGWRALRADSRAVRAAVHINPSTINFFSDEGLMRVTVVNTLPVPVEGIHVQLVPATSILQVIDQPEPFTVGPGSRATVSFRARAITRGQTTVTAELTAPNGTAFGDSAAVEVRVQPTGTWIYWVLGGLAGVLFVLGAVRAVRRGPRDLNLSQEQQ